MKKVLFVMTLLFCQIVALAQQRIKARIVDKNSNQAIAGAVIYTPNNKFSTVSTSDGEFSLSLPADYTKLLIFAQGYRLTEWKINGSAVIALQSGQAYSLASVEVLDKLPMVNMESQLKYRPVNTSQDLLRSVPGLFIAQHAGGGKAEQIFLRGFDIDHGTDVSIKVDGMPVNMVSHAHGQGYADLHFLIPEVVSEINFAKGPHLIEEGDFATAGSVNFKTTNTFKQEQVKLEYGQFNTARLVLLTNLNNKQKSDQEANLGLEYYFGNGPFEAKQNFHHASLYQGFGKSWKSGSWDRQFSSKIMAYYARWDASGQVPDRAVRSGLINRFGSIDPTEGGTTSRVSYLANYTQSKLNDNNQRISRLHGFYFTQYNFELFSNFTFFLNDTINGDQIKQKESRQQLGYSFENKGKLNYTMGLRFDRVNGNELSRTINRTMLAERLALGNINQLNLYGTVILYKKTMNNFGVNLATRADYFVFNYQDELNLTNKTKANGRISPKLTFSYNRLNHNWFFSNSLGFHSNDARVVVNEESSATLPLAIGSDFGYKYQGNNLRLNATLWHLFLEQELVYVGDEAVVEPSGRTQRYGFEFSGSYLLNSWLILDADLNLCMPRALGVEKGNDYIPLAPTVTSIGGITVKRPSGFGASLRYRYMANRSANENNSIVALGYHVVDANVSYTRKQFELGLSIENVFDIDWNEAQFATESRLRDEVNAVDELHYTPGTPRFVKAKLVYFIRKS